MQSPIQDSMHLDCQTESLADKRYKQTGLEEEGKEMGSSPQGGDAINLRTQRFPHCIVWTPLPPITWLLPFIGHMGIADKHGVIYDFAGPYTIGEGNFAFGKPTRYLQLDVRRCQGEGCDWDTGVASGCADYRKRMHNIFCDNCHSHVARCLNHMRYQGFRSYNMVILCFWFFFRAKYTGIAGVVRTWLPFTFLLALTLIWHFNSN